MSQTDQQASSHWMVRLADSRLFSKLPAANIRILLEEIQKVSVRAGDIIIRQGDAGDYYYIIETGTCRVTRQVDPHGSEVLLAELGPGNAFGEEEMVSGTSRNATVVMATDGELLYPEWDFIDQRVTHDIDEPIFCESFLPTPYPAPSICRWRVCVKSSSGSRPIAAISCAAPPRRPVR